MAPLPSPGRSGNLDVAVDDSLRVAVGHGARELPQEVFGLQLRQRAVLQHLSRPTNTRANTLSALVARHFMYIYTQYIEGNCHF